MRKVYFMLLTVFIINITFSQPIDIITPQSPDYIKQFGEKNDYDLPLEFNIHFLNFIENAKLAIGYQAYWSDSGGALESSWYSIQSTDTNIWETVNNKSEGIQKGLLPANTLIYDNSSAIFESRQIIFDGAGTKSFMCPNAYSGYKGGINSLAISPSINYAHYFGGSINYSLHFRPGPTFYQPMIWNDPGFIEYAGTYCFQDGHEIHPIESVFSSTGYYFVIRGLFFNRAPLWWTDDLQYDYSKKFTFTSNTNQFGLSVNLILIYQDRKDGKRKWNQINDFYKDAAFTSDDRYMVTEWQGKPTLFKTPDFKTVVKQYDTPTYMTACAFSPDDKLIYIACEDHKIYVFDTGLPTKVNNWEIQ